MYIEPSSDIRQMTQVSRQLFNSFVLDGFTEAQAMQFALAQWNSMWKNAHNTNPEVDKA